MFLLHMVDTTVKKLKSQAANILTIANMSFGGASIMATFEGYYSYAILFIFIAALLDRYDGKVARKLQQESELGKQLDSMSDIISFGVAPALLAYQVVLHDFSTVGMIMTVLYIVCGALRLARFNVSESNGYFTGLPITAAGSLLTFTIFFLDFANPVFYMFLTPILAILMISTFTIKKV
ncbi:CDP-diacylglycerol--serine O-phosphatidyltransferase [Caryophanon tenue]|uniref:CDP-diacylglycerol--serine O-phosphatidyltransferase n=1 Tax=Caryophanon tenue TaxID=33978 RepID=A0A1C0YMV2_9BACL|nr:CDP-diacylglycerol--serine O-phosphatidyltransferase [Caryophanon tenue]OCS88498.1 CDP-diacylglycerol--serine O-phosphatidyltransferase [Caryophanon tenue]